MGTLGTRQIVPKSLILLSIKAFGGHKKINKYNNIETLGKILKTRQIVQKSLKSVNITAYKGHKND